MFASVWGGCVCLTSDTVDMVFVLYCGAIRGAACVLGLRGGVIQVVRVLGGLGIEGLVV